MLELAQRDSRFEPELLDERRTSLPVALEGLCMAPRAIERRHQLPPQPLPHRVRGNQKLELRDELRMPAELQIKLCALLEAVESEVVQSSCLVTRKCSTTQIGKSLSPPELEAVRQQRARQAAIPASESLSSPGEVPLEPRSVELFALHDQPVVAPVGHDSPCGQDAAKLRNVEAERRRGR